MPILNYTTKVNAHKTAGEIQSLLVRSGAEAVMNEYAAATGELVAVSFRIRFLGHMVTYRMPARIDAVHKILESEADRPSWRTREHAEKVTWRVMKDWLEAQLALVAAEQADLGDIMLPYAQDPATGLTLIERIRNDGPARLGYGD